MEEGLLTDLLILIVGTLSGVLATLVTSALGRRAERNAERERQQRELRQQYLDPMRLAALELSGQLRHVLEEFQIQKSFTKDQYRLRDWFERCKEYIVNDNLQWSDEDRRRELAMHSGGVGYDAASTLYLTACYLWYATLIRFRKADSHLAQSDERLSQLIKEVRDRFASIEFYPVTQDSAGESMRSLSGGVMTYKEFCESLTDKETRPWFMTLADVFFKLHQQDPEQVKRVAESLDQLANFLDSPMPSVKSKTRFPTLARRSSFILGRRSDYD